MQLAFGETFEALLSGLQGALWRLGGVPALLRMDNLSAATHELRIERRRTLTARFAAVVGHYGTRASRITPGGVAREWRGRESARSAQVRARAGAAAAREPRVREHRQLMTFVREVVEKRFHHRT